jgi:hypothetical protein
MSSVSQVAVAFQQILTVEAAALARETGFIERERKFDGADFAQSLIFGWLQEPHISLDGLIQVLGRREVDLSSSGLSQRFTQECATFFQRLLERLSAMQMQAEEAVDCPLLRRFRAVIVEDSSQIQLPTELTCVWQGCGGSTGTSEASIKLFVRWDVRHGEVWGPRLTEGRRNDHRSPFAIEELSAGSLLLRDLGFFSLTHLRELSRGKGKLKRYAITRLHVGTRLYTRSGHEINLRAILPRQVGEARELGVLAGQEVRLPVRLILVRVPKEAAEQRRKQIWETAQKHGREPGEEALYLADWTIVITNVPRRLASLEEVLVLLRLRGPIERLFRLWKGYGQIDEWGSKKPWRVLVELYAKLAAMLIQQWFIHEGCWSDPHRSLVKAAQVVRREINRVMVALYEGGIEQALTSVLELMGGPGCRLNRRKRQPGTDQLLLEGLDWPLLLLT